MPKSTHSRHIRLWSMLVMSLASQVEGLSRGVTWCRSEAGLLSFASGTQWQIWLEQRANHYMPSTATYMFTCIHVGKYVTWLAEDRRVSSGYSGLPRPIKLTAMKWPKMLKVALNTKQSTYLIWCTVPMTQCRTNPLVPRPGHSDFWPMCDQVAFSRSLVKSQSGQVEF